MRWTGAMLAFVLNLAVPGAAGSADTGATALDLLFSTPHLAALEEGAELRYRHQRRSSIAGAIGQDHDRLITLAKGDPRAREEGAVTVTMDADGAPRILDPFRGVTGNPILLVFLESSVSAISRATGGSPFYLRNRVRERLRTGLSETGQAGSDGGRVLSMRPFAGDRNAGRLGDFVDLEYRFTLSENAPGMFLSLSALMPEGTEPAYFEEITLEDDR
ncbi:MAG: hypothetical protein AAGG06_07570 [Pseudomonadota bacterium]